MSTFVAPDKGRVRGATIEAAGNEHDESSFRLVIDRRGSQTHTHLFIRPRNKGVHATARRPQTLNRVV